MNPLNESKMPSSVNPFIYHQSVFVIFKDESSEWYTTTFIGQLNPFIHLQIVVKSFIWQKETLRFRC